MNRSEPKALRSAGSGGRDFHVHVSSLTTRRVTRVLANGQCFAVFEIGGDILDRPDEPLGFFHNDTRYLSRFELRIAGEIPYLLDSYASHEKAQIRINLSNPDLEFNGAGIKLPRNSIQIERDWVIAASAVFHNAIIRNYTRTPIEIAIDFLFAVDFADLFELRGFKRAHRGQYSQPETRDASVRFLYRGLDDSQRFSEIAFDPAPGLLRADRASFLFTLEPDEQKQVEVRVAGGKEKPATSIHLPARFQQALDERRAEIARYQEGWCTISASYEPLESLLRQSVIDLTSVIRDGPEGTFMMAGIPWFATLFGRDSILTALFTLPFNPALAHGTLKTLAAFQGSEVNHARDEQPGKIVHEIRHGELAATGEVPFGRYYGSVDSTPLFLWLLGRYVATTGDLELADELWSNVELALDWIQRWGDADGDLFIEYHRKTAQGLDNQGWKDSSDAISHADGSLAKAPIALCEVQGYVYAAYRSIAAVAERLGRDELCNRLIERAAALRARFLSSFWLESERTIALALDADKKPCRVLASNAGHCLTTGLLEQDQGEAVAANLTGADMFSGWGVRTLGCHELRYNPMSYHNGSVWPHDNAMLAAGLSRYHAHQGVMKILEGLLQASVQLKTGSLPELFCGFPREERLGPVPYPVACHPQAWSAASIFMILQAMLRIEVRAFARRVVMESPTMPPWLDWLKIENLKVGDGSVSLLLRRSPEGALIGIIDRRGDVVVEVIK